MVATVTLKIHKVRPTFKAFLVDDYSVVLRSLCQTEELASEWEGQKKRGQIKHWVQHVKSLRKTACWTKIDHISQVCLTNTASFSSAAP